MPLDINSNPQYERMCESPSYASNPVLLDAVAIVVRKSALSLQTDTRLLAYPPPPNNTQMRVHTDVRVCVYVVTEREGCEFRVGCAGSHDFRCYCCGARDGFI